MTGKKHPTHARGQQKALGTYPSFLAALLFAAGDAKR